MTSVQANSIYKKYCELRVEQPFTSALSIYKQLQNNIPTHEVNIDYRSVDYWEVSWTEATFLMKGRILFESDEEVDLSYLGEPRWITRNRTQPWQNIKFENFKPAVSYEEHYLGLISLKYSKVDADRLARQFVREDYNRYNSYGQTWRMHTLVTHATYRDYILGSSYLGSVESDSGLRYFVEVWKDQLAADAITEARRNLVRIQADPQLLDTFNRI